MRRSTAVLLLLAQLLLAPAEAARLVPNKLSIVRDSLRSAPTAAALPVVGSIDTRGWTGQWRAGAAALQTSFAYSTVGSEFDPDNAPIALPRVRQGFDSSGNASSSSDTVIVTRRVRQPYTGAANTHLLPDGATVALSDYVYASPV
ncbi:hypothetical protein, partial [Roseisolibacter sp. H3M3-2]|uniref:hypothetical protein n=1 Tax=Roseisolibacter sp. H3M3-2 TaxID=3031323 RepID=UPI0023DAA20D